MVSELMAARQAMMKASYKLDVVQRQVGDIQKQFTGIQDQLNRWETLLQGMVNSQRRTTEPALGRCTLEGNFKYPSTGCSVVATGWDEDPLPRSSLASSTWNHQNPSHEPALVMQWPQNPKEYLSQPQFQYPARQWNLNSSNGSEKKALSAMYKNADPNEVGEIQKDESALKGSDAKTKSNDPTEAPSQPVETNDKAEEKKRVNEFGDEDKINKVVAVKTNFVMANVPDEAKFYLAQLYMVGRADKRLRCTGLFWKLPPWPDFCAMNCDRFAQHSGNELAKCVMGREGKALNPEEEKVLEASGEETVANHEELGSNGDAKCDPASSGGAAGNYHGEIESSGNVMIDLPSSGSGSEAQNAKLGSNDSADVAASIVAEKGHNFEPAVSEEEKVQVMDAEKSNGEELPLKKSTFSYTDEVKERFNRILKDYVGTHNFHNFTTRTKAEDSAAKRFIISFSAECVISLEGIDFIRCEVVGQSFMLHQIRRMIGLAVAVLRNCAPESMYDVTFRKGVNLNVPTAPEVGLYLDECMFTSYDKKWKDLHEAVPMEPYSEEAEEFKIKYIFSHIAAVYGSYCYQLPRRHSPMLYTVVKHSEDYMLSKVEELILSNFVIGKEQNVHAEGDSLWSKENICLPGHQPSYSSEPSAAVNVPYSLGKLLQLAADKNRSVVLGVAGAGYRDILMSWVGRLRHLRFTNFVVCALDHETYEFSVLEGLPVFRDPLSPKNVSYDNCHFGTQCFQQVTKVKSRVVLEILGLGYNVLLSDVDVYWFDNPGQINEHTNSLRQWVGQSKDKAEKNQAIGHSENENSCQLCKVAKLNFEPPPIYCSPCGARIKRNASYYTGSTTEARHHFCTLCYNESRSHTINMEGIQFLKANFEKRRNDDEAEEGWVQCDKCECWQHQICALFNVRRNGEGVAENTYHNCYVQEIKHGLCMPLPESALLGVKDLPRSVLSIIWLVDKELEKLEGVEVGLIGMYVQEFGAEGAFPNQRRIYLSFLDSVKHYKPEIKIVSGKGLQVRENELPAKVVTRPKRAFNSQSLQSNINEDGLMETREPYGKWQLGCVHSLAQCPVDVWSEKCLPPGTVHLRLPRLVQFARRLGVDFADQTLEDKWVAEGKEMSELEISECERCVIFSLKITLHRDSWYQQRARISS